jgi:hypothetical protein
MSTALNVGYTQYYINPAILAVADVLGVYLAVKVGLEFQIVKVDAANWSVQTGNRIFLINQNTDHMQLRNRVIFVPKNAVNLCFTGVAGSNMPNKRAIWVKRSVNTMMYDYLAVTSIDYFSDYWSVLEYPDVNFVDGIGYNFANLTSEHEGMRVDFDGQYVGGVSIVNGTTSLTLDNASFNSNGPSRAFLYAQGSLEFALDNSGIPGTWSRHLSLPVIDTDIPCKFWLRDFKTVSSSITMYVNNSIRILGTEFLL